MAEAASGPALKGKALALQTLLAGMSKSAKTVALYKDGHPTILDITGRVHALLLKTLGQDTTMTVDIKAKTVVLEDVELPEDPEVASLAYALHTIGVGQVLFTNRVTPEGLLQFFRIVVAKADEKNTLTDLQKAVQQVRIDGLQMTFILSFVVTGETEQEEQAPGLLSEEEVAAFCRAASLPDLLTLLLKQNEPLHGKEAEAVTDLLDSVLHRDATLEALEEGMPWERYDERIRRRFTELAGAARRPPRRPAGGERGPRWRWEATASWAACLHADDRAALESHQVHEKNDAMRWCLDELKALLDGGMHERQAKHALLAYARLLVEMGKDGLVAPLMAEVPRWKTMVAAPRLKAHAPLLGAALSEGLLTPSFMERLAASVAELEKGTAPFGRCVDLLGYLGEGCVPLLLAELAKAQDKTHRARLCSLLAQSASLLGTGLLGAALQDPDWFVASNVVAIFVEIGDPSCGPLLRPLLKHGHAKVREAACKALLKFPEAEGIAAACDYLASGEPEEVSKLVIAVSLVSLPGLDKMLISACERTPHDDTQLALLTALGRFPTNDSLHFLKAKARRTWYEILTNRRADVVKAAKQSLEILKREGKV